MNTIIHRCCWSICCVMILVAAGCAGRVSAVPNSDKSLRKTPAQFAADAAKRHPYKADAPAGGEANARAQVGYWVDNIDLANLSDEDWVDVDVWVNQKYVVHLDKVEKRPAVKKINFEMLFDDQGNHFPLKNSEVHVDKIELLQEGKMFQVPVRLAD